MNKYNYTQIIVFIIKFTWNQVNYSLTLVQSTSLVISYLSSKTADKAFRNFSTNI